MRHTFDLTMNITVTVAHAKSEAEAREAIEVRFCDMDINMGAWPDGNPIIGNGNLIDAPTLVGINGEPV